jgi:hypothetical protein
MIGFNGGLIGKDRTTTLVAAVGVWTPGEQIKARRNDIWPVIVTGYRYIRWTITAIRTPGGGTIQVAEFNLINGASNINMSGSTVTISPAGASGSGSETIASLKDGNTATKWFSSISGALALPHIITFDMGTVTEFNAYRWATAGDAEGRDPVSWTVSGSLDNSTFTTLDTETNFATTTSRQTYVGPFTI